MRTNTVQIGTVSWSEKSHRHECERNDRNWLIFSIKNQHGTWRAHCGKYVWRTLWFRMYKDFVYWPIWSEKGFQSTWNCRVILKTHVSSWKSRFFMTFFNYPLGIGLEELIVVPYVVLYAKTDHSEDIANHWVAKLGFKQVAKNC